MIKWVFFFFFDWSVYRTVHTDVYIIFQADEGEIFVSCLLLWTKGMYFICKCRERKRRERELGGEDWELEMDKIREREKERICMNE